MGKILTSVVCAGLLSLNAQAATSKIQHLVVFIQENHSFDSYFGTYCQAPAGSNPSCEKGAECCEAAPALDPGTGRAATPLTDAENAAYSPDHGYACELEEMNGGRMDRFGSAACGSPRNFALAGEDTARGYRDLARAGAIADHYFQPVSGASSSNDMYFARAGFVFQDNAVEPRSLGSLCGTSPNPNRVDFHEPTIGDLLARAGVRWTFFAEGYADMVEAQSRGACPKAPAECPAGRDDWPCIYDPSDNPFSYYPTLQDKPEFIQDVKRLRADIAAGKLPAVSFVKAIGYRSEHPGDGTDVSAGERFVTGLIGDILRSPAGRDTLILVTMDESGGYFDHVAPPGESPVDHKPYGPRLPLIAVGPFARAGGISHVTMEHSSIVKFIEWNWLGGRTGQLGTRDAVVNNLGSLLDPSKTGTRVPE